MQDLLFFCFQSLALNYFFLREREISGLPNHVLQIERLQSMQNKLPKNWAWLISFFLYIRDKKKEHILVIPAHFHGHSCTCNSNNEAICYLYCTFPPFQISNDLTLFYGPDKAWNRCGLPIIERYREKSLAGMKQMLASCSPLTWLFFGHIRQALVIDNDAN